MAFVSFFDLFKVGIGPSSSHTVGPMRAAMAFRARLRETQPADHIVVTLYGSLAHTGRGHGTDRAVVWGLAGLSTEHFEPEAAARALRWSRQEGVVDIEGRPVRLRFAEDIVFDTVRPVRTHPNELRLQAFSSAQELILEETWLSVGGGFISRPDAGVANGGPAVSVPLGFDSAAELLALGEQHKKPIWALMLDNELALRPRAEIDQQVSRIWEVMQACIQRGLQTRGILPGGLSVRRRAADLYQTFTRRTDATLAPSPNDYLLVWAMAVNEENAAGGQVVTAPTNGAAGIVPAVLQYYFEHLADGQLDRPEALLRFYLTATAVGGLFKRNASISGAEVGCQGEVGTAASMAAAGLCALLGGSNCQIEHAAEVAIEHSLGLTCDPVGGLVQVPCIERNGFGATQAVTAARLAMHEDGQHRVTLDQAIETMRRTGEDMNARYKETSLGGLAVSVVEC